MVASVASGVAGLLGFEGLNESWETRLREAAYTSPKGTRITFNYRAVSREFDKRNAVFDFPGVNNSYVQENGHSSRRYPMGCVFDGSNCDRLATAFEQALTEPGIGKLEHPLYGTIDVVPHGTITRRDDLVNEANVAIVEVTFWTTTGAIYPKSTVDPQSEILAALAGFDVEVAQELASRLDLVNAVQRAAAKATVRGFLKDIAATVEGLSDKVALVSREFHDIQSTINLGLDAMIGAPLQLAQQVVNLIRAPARVASGLTGRLEGYAALATRIMGSLAGSPDRTLSKGETLTTRTTRIANGFHLADLVAMGVVAATVTAIAADPIGDEEAQPGTRTQAIAAADALLAQFDQITAWRDRGFARLASVPNLGTYQVDTGGAYQQLQQAVALTAGNLIRLSFTLQPTRTVELERDTTIINAAAELYGEIDAALDTIINTNDLTGSEILELKRGQKLVYFST